MGGTDSLIRHPTTTVHSGLTEQARREIGITPSLVRMSDFAERRGARSASTFECLDVDHAAAAAWFGLASARPKRQSQPRNLVIGWMSA
jgi:Cys/Met metabolism PLP-dependent enzyme